MHRQFIEVKVMIELTTDEEISCTEAEEMIKNEVSGALEERFNSFKIRAEQWSPPFYKVLEITI